jgi:hypothetical protein
LQFRNWAEPRGESRAFHSGQICLKGARFESIFSLLRFMKKNRGKSQTSSIMALDHNAELDEIRVRLRTVLDHSAWVETRIREIETRKQNVLNQERRSLSPIPISLLNFAFPVSDSIIPESEQIRNCIKWFNHCKMKWLQLLPLNGRWSLISQDCQIDHPPDVNFFIQIESPKLSRLGV